MEKGFLIDSSRIYSIFLLLKGDFFLADEFSLERCLAYSTSGECERHSVILFWLVDPPMLPIRWLF